MRSYGFASWRAQGPLSTRLPASVFAAANAGDVETVRCPFDGDPSFTQHDGRTVHRIGKPGGNEAIVSLFAISCRAAIVRSRRNRRSRPWRRTARTSSADCSIHIPT
ncbi:hypothetical protein SAMN05216525_13188 [Bradyrhizobium sp. Gha]|nr:hypothetical protein SAMN05216525_13188 [Bradyrhizobium sp. Gha]